MSGKKDATSMDMLLDEIIANANEQVLRIILFETLAIIISDSVFDEKEKEFVNMLISKFGISKEMSDEMLESLYEYLKIFNKINSLVL